MNDVKVHFTTAPPWQQQPYKPLPYSPPPEIVQVGWQCPNCKAGLAPFMPYCPYCSPKTITTTTSSSAFTSCGVCEPPECESANECDRRRKGRGIR